MEKDKIIKLIEDRIKSEYIKHSKSIEDWYKIAAIKIYNNLFIELEKNKKTKN